MKKTYLIAATLFLSQFSFSQKSAVTEAILEMQKGDLVDAKENIDKAVAHEDTKNDPKAWYNRGVIYMQLMISQKPEHKALTTPEEASEVVLESWKNTYEFDTKGKYKSDMKSMIGAMNQGLFSVGLNYFNKGNSSNEIIYFDSAFMTFASADELYSIVKIKDTTILYNTGLSAQRAEKIDEAIEYYQKYIEAGGGKETPSSASLRMTSVRKLLEEGKVEEAEKILKEEVAKDPNNSQVRFAIGVVYDNLKDFEKAKEAYAKAIELDETNFNALYNLGLLYSNTASDVNAKMNDLPLDAQTEYDKLKTERDTLLKEGLPYLEKAYAKENDAQLKGVLNQTYNALGMSDKIIK